MTITTSTATWDGQVNKASTPLAFDISRLKMYLVTVTYGAGDNYVTGGNVVSLKAKGVNTILAAIPVTLNKGLEVQYIISTGAIQCYGSNGASPNLLLELPNANGGVNSMVVTFLVIGR